MLGFPNEFTIVWTEYVRHRAALRGFDLQKVESLIRYSGERYLDTTTRRLIVIGNHIEQLVMVAYETECSQIIHVTIHSITRQQINFRLKTGRFVHE